MNGRRTWQRLALSLFGIVIVAANWRWAVNHLYTLPEHSIAAFTSITNNAAYVIGAIVVFMITGRLITDWKTSAFTNLFSRSEDDPPSDTSATSPQPISTRRED